LRNEIRKEEKPKRLELSQAWDQAKTEILFV